MSEPNTIAEYLQFIEVTERALALMESLRVAGWDARALAVAKTHLETAQLWATNASP